MMISWKTFSLYSLCCFALGVVAGALALRWLKRQKRTEIYGKENMDKTEKDLDGNRDGAEIKNPESGPTISALAESIWLREKPVTLSGATLSDNVLSDSADTQTPDFNQPQTKDFWKEVIAPFASAFEKRKELCVIKKILVTLDQEGLCSSVVSGDGKSTFPLTSKRFSKVTLLSHSLRTARHIRDIYNSVHKEKVLYGKHLIAALAHDIGKIEKFRSQGKYVKDDHPVASARMLHHWVVQCEGEDVAIEFSAVVDAVRNHHRSSDTPGSLLDVLKNADTSAREEEFSGVRGKPEKEPSWTHRNRSGEPPKWLLTSIAQILNERILPIINTPVLEREPFIAAVSTTSGVVYVDPHYLFDRVREHMESEEIADLRFFDSSREIELAAKLCVTNALRARGWVGEEVAEGYYACFWNYTYKGKKIKRGGFWIPIFVEAFDADLSELEGRKNADIRRLTEISANLTSGRYRKKD